MEFSGGAARYGRIDFLGTQPVRGDKDKVGLDFGFD